MDVVLSFCEDFVSQAYYNALVDNHNNSAQKQSPGCVMLKKVFLKISQKFTGKRMCQSLLFNKVAGPRPAALIKKRLWHGCFPVNFAKFLKTPFSIEHLRWLLLRDLQGLEVMQYLLCQVVLTSH